MIGRFTERFFSYILGINMREYDHKKIEGKWQREWSREKINKTKENPGQPKCYVLDMFPYPSGEGMHVGHPKGYISTDVFSRFKKMNGYNVLHPMGWDAFGLPAENYAIKNKTHPRKMVEKNVERYKKTTFHNPIQFLCDSFIDSGQLRPDRSESKRSA